MANILKQPSHKARLGYNGHDMSRRVLFTSSTGHLIPVLYDYLEPGTKIRVNDRLFTRTQPLKTCAFLRLTEHIDYFFVPMDQIDGYFQQSFYGIQDSHNTNDVTIVEQSTMAFNRVTQPQLLPSINFASSIFNWSQQSTVLPHDIGLGWGTTTTKTFGYRFNVVGVDSNGNMIATQSEPTSDSSYGSALDHYELWLMSAFDNTLNLFEGFNFDTQMMFYGGLAGFTPFGTPFIMDMFRLCSMLGMGERFMIYDNSMPNTALIPRYLAAYQKIWYDYFRCQDYTQNNPFAYNLNAAFKDGDYDSYYPSSGYNGNADMFTLRYRPFKKDYFTSVQTSPLFNPAITTYGYTPTGYSFSRLADTGNNIVSAFNAQLQQYGVSSVFPGVKNLSSLGADDTFPYTVPFSSGNNRVDTVNYHLSSGGSSQADVFSSVQQLRAAFAFDRMMAITQRAGKTYEDQTLAHYGYSVPQGVRNHVYYLGGHSTPLQIGEVVATAAGSAGDTSYDSSVLGQIAGRGLGASGKQRTIKFTAPCHGIMMALYSVIPDIEYRNFGFDKRVFAQGTNDFPRVEFDRLGMQPLYLQEAFGSLGGDKGETANPYGYSFTLGWQYRYEHYKLSYDVVCGAFNYTLRDWTSGIIFGQFANSNVFDSAFYCPPTYLDSIMAVGYNPVPHTTPGSPTSSKALYYVISSNVRQYDWSTFVSQAQFSEFSFQNVFERDPLLHSIDFTYRKVDKYSTYGLPNL